MKLKKLIVRRFLGLSLSPLTDRSHDAPVTRDLVLHGTKPDEGSMKRKLPKVGANKTNRIRLV